MAVSNRCSASKKSPAFSGAMWCLYRKPTQVGEEKILRRLRELWLRNSANFHRNFGRRWAQGREGPASGACLGRREMAVATVYQKHRTLQTRKRMYRV